MSRPVIIRINVEQTPLNRQQHVVGKRRSHCASFSLNRPVPSIRPRRLEDLNKLYALTEDGTLHFGWDFIELRTDKPDAHDYREIALAICQLFNWSLEECTITRRDQGKVAKTLRAV
jgi:hypothetical protein